MRVIKVIESKVWKHKVTGKNVSIYGASPWQGQADKEDWEMVTRGWTWEKLESNGTTTIGLCRVPAKTYEEAVAVMEAYNAKQEELAQAWRDAMEKAEA
jgi:hypothetical protein